MNVRVGEVAGHRERKSMARLVYILTLLLIYSRSSATIYVHISRFLHPNIRNMEFMSRLLARIKQINAQHTG